MSELEKQLEIEPSGNSPWSAPSEEYTFRAEGVKLAESDTEQYTIPLMSAPINLDEFILSYRNFLLYLKSKGFGVGDEQEEFLDKVAGWAKTHQQNDD